MQTPKPFLKWVGGKRSILPQLVERMPSLSSFTTYKELFFGGGALFFEIQPDISCLSDINTGLISTYQAIQSGCNLSPFLDFHAENHSPEYYKQMVKDFQQSHQLSKEKAAALFIYINKTCFNGLYRVNSKGLFNVPVGTIRKKTVLYCPDNLKACRLALLGAEIHPHPYDFFPPTGGDFYYFDPPYHQTFGGYSDKGFTEENQKSLASYCKKVDSVGSYFMYSNSDTPFIRSLFAGFRIETVQAMRSVSCKGTQRGTKQELIIRNY